jgi:hypothetical protein
VSGMQIVNIGHAHRHHRMERAAIEGRGSPCIERLDPSLKGDPSATDCSLKRRTGHITGANARSAYASLALLRRFFIGSLFWRRASAQQGIRTGVDPARSRHGLPSTRRLGVTIKPCRDVLPLPGAGPRDWDPCPSQLWEGRLVWNWPRKGLWERRSHAQPRRVGERLTGQGSERSRNGECEQALSGWTVAVKGLRI